jgi:hypothetical protein
MGHTEAQHCWEYWDCPEAKRAECPSFLNHNGRECYSFAENYCPRLESEFERCWECPWFKKIRPDFKLKESDIKD